MDEPGERERDAVDELVDADVLDLPSVDASCTLDAVENALPLLFFFLAFGGSVNFIGCGVLAVLFAPDEEVFSPSALLF